MVGDPGLNRQQVGGGRSPSTLADVFTGIIEAVGHVAEAEQTDEGRRFRIEAGAIAGGLPIGASVSINGTCLTATDVDPPVFTVELVSETLRRTTLGGLTVGAAVNLERALPAAGRFDGHIVQGHVDGVGVVVSVRDAGAGRLIEIDAPREVSAYLVEKGSVTIDGVSLTVTHVDGARFGVALIPHTLHITTLGSLVPGLTVNLEADVLAKYIEKLLERRVP